MNYQDLKRIIEPILGHEISGEQEEIIQHGNGPLWVIAGPGSGKSEVLVIRTLKLIFIDNVNPKSIIITTFTEKAAKNLFDRILNYSMDIFGYYPSLSTVIDVHSLRIGTLHSLCNDIMLESRYSGYENYRLLDDIEQNLFVYEHSSFAAGSNLDLLPLFEHFAYLFDKWDPINRSHGWNDHARLPNRWRRTMAAVDFFDRIVEDQIDLGLMRNSGGIWGLLSDAYEDYFRSLESNRRCDFAHLQRKFLEFLGSPMGRLFLDGDGSRIHPGIRYVLVDEYQDTNPIQEAIYFAISGNTHNLCIVGDDDQALYRFRGGTVECMVTFDHACNRAWGVPFDNNSKKFLSVNYRSHPNIVAYYDQYISSFEVMRLDRARVRGKPRLSSQSTISGDYPAVAYIQGSRIDEAANNFAIFVRGLLDNNIIEMPSQCVLLMKSVKETRNYAGPFADALRRVGIMPYNPRSRTFLEQDEISALLGTFISIVDADLNALDSIRGLGITNIVNRWIAAYQGIAANNPPLANYVVQSIGSIRAKGRNAWLDSSILDIFYHILSHEPFRAWKNDPEFSYRLGKLSRLFEAYSSVPYPNAPGSNRSRLRTSSTAEGQISFRWRQNFYYSLIGLLVKEGINDPESEDIISPPNRLPIMTVHQAKGLEFDFVFVYGINRTLRPDNAVRLEDAFSQFRHDPPAVRFDTDQRAEQDLIRFYYVAYSRAKYGLIHILPRSHFENGKIGFINKSIATFKQNVRRLR